MSARLLPGMLAAALLLGACDSPSTSSRPGPPARLDVVSGDAQRDTVGQELPQALVVRVLDQRGRPVPDQVVNFRVTAGNGTVFAGSASTNDDGEARERWTLGVVAGDTQRVEARAVDSRTGQALVLGSFWAVGTPHVLAALTPVGSAQAGTAEDPLADSLAVRATDRHGNAIAGVQVSWAAAEGGGTLSPATSTTDSAGIARSRWTLGPAVGGQAALASAGGVEPARMTAAAAALPAVRIQITPRELRFGALGDVAPLSVTAFNRNGAAIGGLPVTLSTDDPGVVGVTLVPAALSVGNGATRVIAALGELRDTIPATVRQVVTRLEVSPDSMALVAGSTAQLTVRAADANNRPVQDAAISFTSSAPGAATVDGTGTVRAVGAGRAQITVSAGALSATRPVRVFDPRLHATAIGSGDDASCAIDDAGRTLCWGRWPDGDSHSPRFVPFVVGGPRLASVEVGSGFACGLTANGAAYCWGANGHGQLGNGSTTSSSAPVAVAGQHRFTALTAGFAFTCGLTAGGAAFCWGAGLEGTLGTGKWESATAPAAVSGGYSFASLAASDHHACGVTTDGAAYCWGLNTEGELGVPAEDCVSPYRREPAQGCHNAPLAVSGPVRFRTLALGYAHSCGLATDGRAHCWGDASGGKLGNGSTEGSTHTPAAVAGGHTFASITSGGYTVCATTTGGLATCWGYNFDGQYGNGTTTSSAAPVAVDRGRAFARLAIGRVHACGISADGIAYCWGEAASGQLGGVTRDPSYSPKPVVSPD